jgi:hypothetical protein
MGIDVVIGVLRNMLVLEVFGSMPIRPRSLLYFELSPSGENQPFEK